MKEPYLTLTHENYLSLSDIMVTEEKLLCTLTVDFFGLGYIQPSSVSTAGELKEGTTLDLPFWMVSPLKRSEYAEFQLPSAYQEEARRILCADPGIVEFRQGSRCRFSQNHFPFGLYLIPLAENDDFSVTSLDVKRKSLSIAEAKDVRASLVNTFQLRFRQIMNWSTRTGQDGKNQDAKRFDRSEKQLLEIGTTENCLLEAWLRRKSKTLKPSSAVKSVRPQPSHYSESRKRARVET